MKNNSFKHISKKMVLTGLLATVLSGPYVFQISSKDFHFAEFASKAAESVEAERLDIEYTARLESALERYKKIHPSITSLPESKSLSADDPFKKELEDLEARKVVLDKKKIDADIARREKEEKERREARAEEDRKAAAKKKEEDEAKKKKDCSLEKTSAEKRECREDARREEKEEKEKAKREEKEAKEKAALEKFQKKIGDAFDRCESRNDKDEDKELACRSRAFTEVLKSSGRDKNLLPGEVMGEFKELIGNDLFKSLYSDDEREAEKASIIISNLFNGSMPKQFRGLRQLIMDQVRQKSAAPVSKVKAEFNKLKSLDKNSNAYTNQFMVAVGAKEALVEKMSIYSTAMGNTLQNSRTDVDAITYYKQNFTVQMDKIINSMAIPLATGGEHAGANRGGVTRGGTSTEVEGGLATSKMTRSERGVSFPLQSPGTIENISFGTAGSDRVPLIRGSKVRQ